MTDAPSPIDTIESLSPGWGLVVFALLIVAVGFWIVWKYADRP